MIQKKGKYGNINITGEPKSSAMIFNNKIPDFLDEVEDGVKDIMKVLIENDFDTFTSCEGHFYNENDYNIRNLDVIIEKDDLNLWEKYIEIINIKYDLKLKYEDYELYSNSFNILNKTYKEPIRFKIIIGKPINKKLNEYTEILADSFRNKEYPYGNNDLQKI